LRPSPEPTRDAFINLTQLKASTKEIKVILINPFSSRVIALTKDSFNGEENFENNADCTFVARQPTQITKIYEILRRAGLHPAPAGYHRYEPTEAIFIRSKNGEMEKFFFERHYANVDWTAGDYNAISVLASPMLIDDLYDLEITTNPNAPCVEYLKAERRTL